MSEASDQDIDLPEPPGDFLTYRANVIVALMNDADEVVSAIDDLVQAGFAHDEIFVLSGPKGAERLDPSGRHHGLRRRLYRFVERFGGEREHLERYAEHMAAGGFSIAVPADENRKDEAARILGSHGAHGMTHYGKGHWERLGS